jgi:hypothetical protein
VIDIQGRHRETSCREVKTKQSPGLGGGRCSPKVSAIGGTDSRVWPPFPPVELGIVVVSLVGAPPSSDQFSPEFESAGTAARRQPDAKPYDVRPLAQRRSAESKSMRRQYPALLARFPLLMFRQAYLVKPNDSADSHFATPLPATPGEALGERPRTTSRMKTTSLRIRRTTHAE